MYCEKTGLDKVSGPCDPQYYCKRGAESNQPSDGTTGNICPLGKYCTEGTSTPYDCPAGSYMDLEGNANPACFSCPGGKYCGVADETGGSDCGAGYYCLSGNTVPNPGEDVGEEIGGPCPAGTFCPKGTTSPQDCPDGTYNDETAQEVCKKCPAGFYCDEKYDYLATNLTELVEPKECPQGSYCPEETGGDWVPCERGTYGATTGLETQDGCTDCPAGKYCAAPGLKQPTDQCDVGYYCTSKATQKNPTDGTTGNSCGMGTYCVGGSEKATECDAGTYNDKQKQGACKDCPAGYTCEVGATDYQTYECEPGYWCPAGSSLATARKCDTGTFNPDLRGSSEGACQHCTRGYYCDTPALDSPTDKCDPGYYCTGSATSATPPDGDTGGACTAGHICPEGSASQQLCPARYFCQSPGMSAVTDDHLCPAKYYCPDRTSDAESHECTAGNYCPKGTGATPLPCPAGRYSAALGLSADTACSPCDAGYYCPQTGQTEVNKVDHVCPEGYYCPQGTAQKDTFRCKAGAKCPPGKASPVKCEGGAFQAQQGMIACEACPPGKYCDPSPDSDVGVISPADCPAGHYCEGGNTKGQECPSGTKSLETQITSVEECTRCPAGKYCELAGKITDSGNCLEGFYCKKGATRSDPPSDDLGNGPCPAGSYCTAGAGTPTSCPLGTYRGSENGKSVDDCVECDVGRYCNELGLTATSGPCTAGYYCVSKNTSPTPNEDLVGRPCDLGHYCEAGKDQQECPAGTYSSKQSLESADDCEPCPAGKYCEGGKSSTSGDCEPGCFCPTGSSVQCERECAPGHYCEGTSPDKVQCPDGYYQDEVRKSECTECNPGKMCPVGSTAQQPCTAGHYCPGGTGEARNLMPCPAGTYTNKTDLSGEEDCTQCDGGWYCDEPGLTAPKGQCDPGYYCTSGVNSKTPSFSGTGTGGQCQAGFYCEKGSVHQEPCLGGSYTDTVGATECEECIAGYVCKTQAATYEENPCDAGHYCPAGSFEQVPCEHGTYNPDTLASTSSSCIPCDKGQWCSGGKGSPNGPCTEGWYCSSSSTSATPEQGDTGGPCPEGSYCPEGISAPVPCEAGFYCPDVRQPEYKREHECEAGYYCDGGASDPTHHDCPAGSFCGKGSSTPEPCSVGTFSAATRLARVEDCTQCTAGKYCQETGLTAPSADCQEGYLCATGSTQADPEPCPLGHYCPKGSSQGVLCGDGTWASAKGHVVCDTCPSGQYCTQEDENTLSIATDCPVGYWCPEGSSNSRQRPCLKGTYGTSAGLSEAGQCADCIAGYYCDLSDPAKLTGKCDAGHYCTGRAETASPGNQATQDETGGKYVGNGKCPIGHYCEVGTVQPEPCPKGTYSSKPELTSATGPSGCTPCGPGKYCDLLGAISDTVETPCERGYICTSGSDIPNPTDSVKGYICPAGHYCLSGDTTESKCGINFYQPAEGKWNCLPCTEGRQCDEQGMTEAKECPAGYYCLSGRTKQPCPRGTYSNVVNLAAADSCLPCKQGYYCPEPGQTESKTLCKNGHYCGGGSEKADPLYDCEITNSTCNGKCPPGHYCQDGVKHPCPAGTYCDVPGAGSVGDCKDCTAGFYCNSRTVTPTLPCSNGYYCEGGNSSPDEFPCTKGHRCGPGTGLPEACPAGMYQPEEGRDQCNHCTESHYCPAGSEDMIECEAYSYCPRGTEDPPPLCPPGRFTDDDKRSNRKAEDCALCPIAKYCLDGRITGDCAAGYICISGNYEHSSPNTHNETNHEGWPCPAGHYCLVGAESGIPCPDDTYRDSPGGTALADCVNCRPGWQCPEGSVTGIPCPAGYYCPSDSDTKPCKVGYYNDEEGQATEDDACKACPAGYYCNEEALPSKEGHECPVGHYCTGMDQKERCPEGFMRDIVGGTSNDGCRACSPGRYCDGESEQGHISGYSCPAGFYCQYNENEGTPNYKACPTGYFCPNGTDEPLTCTAGFYCPPECHTPVRCGYPFYCPAGSENPLTCPLGWLAATETGALRANLNEFCTPCKAGLYGNLNGKLCLSCPEGHYCVKGTNGPDVWNGTYTCPDGGTCPVPCPEGTYCPLQSPYPTPCPVGTYNDGNMGSGAEVCRSCSANTYNIFTGQAKCKPCGSSAESEEGARVCTCVGQNRYFLMSDGSCRCKSGFIFYDETDKRETDGNSKFDCQRAVDERCQAGQMRLSSTRQCVTIDQYNCTTECGDSGGTLVPDIGRCICNKLVDPTEICDDECNKAKPTFSVQVDQATGKLRLISTHENGTTTTVELPRVTGYKEYDTMKRRTQMVSFTEQGFQGKIYGDQESAVKDLVQPDSRQRRSVQFEYGYEGTTFSVGHNGTQFRVKRADTVQTGIADPTVCLDEGEVVAWMLYEVDGVKHYPAYIKDHLLNDNAEFDYGPFDRLGEILTTTGAQYNTFVHEFPNAGTYVFKDMGQPGSQMIVRVMPATSSCTSYPYQVLPTNVDNLTKLGINKSSVSNLSPNWAMIASLMSLFVAALIGLLITVIIWKPTAWGLLPADKIRPRYKAISGAPPDPIFLLPDKVQPSYDIRQEKGFFDDIIEEGGGAQMVSAAYSSSAGNALMENLSVRTLYDKIDDQNMFLAAQLSRHQEDIKGFYRTICQQNDHLKDLLEKTDFSKIQKIKSDERSPDGTQHITLVKSSAIDDLPFSKKLFTSTGNPREDELISVLAGLLKKIESEGKEFVAEYAGGNGPTSVIEHHFTAINDLERSILRDEEHKLKKTVDTIDHDMKQEIQFENKELAAQLRDAGDNNSQVAAILNSHEDKIVKLRERFEDKRRTALSDLETRLLAEREEKYRRAISAPDVPEEVKGFVVESMIDKSILNFKNNLAVTASNHSIVSDQTLLDRLEEDAALSIQLTGEMESMLQDRVDSVLASLVDDETITEEDKEIIKREAIDRQALLKQQIESRKNHHRDVMKKKMQDRRRKKVNSLPEKHAREMAKLLSSLSVTSSQITSSSFYTSSSYGTSAESLNTDIKEKVSTGQLTERGAGELREQLKEQQDSEKEQVAAHLDAEEMEELHKIEKLLDDEYKNSSTKLCKDTVLAALKEKGAIPPGQEQETLEKFNKQMESVNTQLKLNETHQTADLEAKVAERKRRKQLALRQEYEDKRIRELKEAQELLKPKLVAVSSSLNVSVVSDLNLPSEAEEALSRQHAENLSRLQQEQREELEALEEKLGADNAGQEEKKLQEITVTNAQELRERKNKLQAELAARVDLSPEDAARLQEAHEKELAKLKDKLEGEKLRQEAGLKEQLAKRRQQRLLEIKKRQDLRKRQELEEQEKEKVEARSERLHDAENAAIRDGLQKNEVALSGEVIKQVLSQRHSQEQEELTRRFEEERKERVDQALLNLDNRLKSGRRQMTDKHAAELAALSEDDEEGRAELLNRQQQELIEFDKKASAERAALLQESMLDWETRRSDALLDLRKRHLQELAKHAQETNVVSAKEEAEANLRELENVRTQLEQDREQALRELEEQKQRYAEEQEQRMSEEIAQFESSLAAEREKEAVRTKKMMESLSKRKDELLAEAEKRKQEKLRAMKEKGASPEETQEIINQHAEEVQRLANKLDADKLRQQQKLQEQLEKRRRKQKAQTIQQIKEKHKQSIVEKDSEMKQKLMAVHANSASKVEKVMSSPATNQAADSGELVRQGLTLDETLELTVPLSETQLQDLLSNSPLTTKIQGIADLIAKTQGGGYIAKLNSEHENDTELIPVDLNDLAPQDFVVYKFGCYVCQVTDPLGSPVTLLLASSIPPNTDFKQNAYRNLFYYDTHNQHLYLRSGLTLDVGSFTTVLVHCLAHAKVGEMGNDSTPEFVETLYSLVSKLCRQLYNNRADKLQEVDLHLLDVQDIFNMKMAGIDTRTEHRLKSRVAAYKEISAHSKLAGDLDENPSNRGTSGKHYQSMLEFRSTTSTGNLITNQMTSNNPPPPTSNTSRYTMRTYKHLALQELQDEEDALNGEFGAVCGDISSLEDTVGGLSHEIVSLTALLESATADQTTQVQANKEQTLAKLNSHRARIAVLKAKQSELARKIKDVNVEITNKSEILSIT